MCTSVLILLAYLHKRRRLRRALAQQNPLNVSPPPPPPHMQQQDLTKSGSVYPNEGELMDQAPPSYHTALGFPKISKEIPKEIKEEEDPPAYGTWTPA